MFVHNFINATHAMLPTTAAMIKHTCQNHDALHNKALRVYSSMHDNNAEELQHLTVILRVQFLTVC